MLNRLITVSVFLLYLTFKCHGHTPIDPAARFRFVVVSTFQMSWSHTIAFRNCVTIKKEGSYRVPEIRPQSQGTQLPLLNIFKEQFLLQTPVGNNGW